MQTVRQGDVMLIPASVPATATETPRQQDGSIVLAFGEVTGHAHRVIEATATLLTDTDARFLRIVGSGASVIHEEHARIAIAPGEYRVVIGREWADDIGIRQVVD